MGKIQLLKHEKHTAYIRYIFSAVASAFPEDSSKTEIKEQILGKWEKIEEMLLSHLSHTFVCYNVPFWSESDGLVKRSRPRGSTEILGIPHKKAK